MSRSSCNMSFSELNIGIKLCSKVLNYTLPSNALAHPITSKIQTYPSVSSIVSSGTPFRSKASSVSERTRRIPGGAKPADSDNVEPSQLATVDETSGKIFQQLMTSDSELETNSLDENRNHQLTSDSESDIESDSSREVSDDVGNIAKVNNVRLKKYRRRRMLRRLVSRKDGRSSMSPSVDSLSLNSYTSETGIENGLQASFKSNENFMDANLKKTPHELDGIAKEDNISMLSDDIPKKAVNKVLLDLQQENDSETQLGTFKDINELNRNDGMEDNSLTLMEACINQYLNFVELFIFGQIIQSQGSTMSKTDVAENESNTLAHVGNQHQINSFTCIVAFSQLEDCAKCVDSACRLLVEFSCFPINSLRQCTGRYPANGYFNISTLIALRM